MVGILNYLVTPRVDDIQFVEGVAVHGAGNKAHIVRVFRFNKDNSEFAHSFVDKIN